MENARHEPPGRMRRRESARHRLAVGSVARGAASEFRVAALADPRSGAPKARPLLSRAVETPLPGEFASAQDDNPRDSSRVDEWPYIARAIAEDAATGDGGH